MKLFILFLCLGFVFSQETYLDAEGNCIWFQDGGSGGIKETALAYYDYATNYDGNSDVFSEFQGSYVASIPSLVKSSGDLTFLNVDYPQSFTITPSNFENNAGLTVGVWIKHEGGLSASGGTSQQNSVYAANWWGSGSGDQFYLRRLGGSIEFNVGAPYSNRHYIRFDFASSAYTSEWQHLVGTWDGEYIRLYENGVLKTEAPITSGRDTFSSSRTIHVCTAGDGSEYFRGYIDDLVFYDRGLSADEVKSLYDETFRTLN